MDELRIRRATAADAEALARVYRSAYQKNRRLGFPARAGSATESDVSDWIRESRVHVATIADDVVGGVRLEAIDSERAKLSRFGVHERWKGEGIGSALLDRAESVLRERGCTVVWLTTPGEHPFLPELYRRRGYEKTGEHPLEYREYDEIVMEKRLR